MRLLFNLFVISLLIISCRKQDEGDFTLNYNRSFTIEAGKSPLLTHYIDFNILTGWNSFLSNNKISISDIDRIAIRNISLTPLFSSDFSYQFIEEVKVYIEDPSKTGSSLQIGSAYPQPNEKSGVLYLLPGIADIKDYVTLPQIKIIIGIRFRELVLSSTDHNLALQFDVFKK